MLERRSIIVTLSGETLEVFSTGCCQQGVYYTDFTQTVSKVLQTALGLIQQWCDRTGLSIKPSKTVIIPVTIKRGLKGLKGPTLFGKTTETKYLGLTLDKGLTWRAQVNKVMTVPTGTSGPVNALSERHGD
jgi:hypothetical protein